MITTKQPAAIDATVPEIKISYSKNPNVEPVKLHHWQTVSNFCHSFFDKDIIELQEQFIVFYLDRKCQLLGWQRHSLGGYNGVLVELRLIFAVALTAGAHNLIFSHNHPSGNPRPSSQDKDLTEKARKIATFHDLNVLDHVIVTADPDTFYSFANEGDLY